MRYFDRAALFVEACLKYGAVGITEDTDILCWDDYAEQEADGMSGFLLVYCLGRNCVRSGTIHTHIHQSQERRRNERERQEEDGCIAGISSKMGGEAGRTVKGWDSKF